jgi:glycosyltransferase involved in cell wall biosynthesis
MDPRGPRGMLRLVTTRSLAPEYGHDTIVRAVGQVVRDGSDVEMHFAGGGAERHRLAVLAESLGIGGRTIFHGEVPYAALPRVLAEADIYVSMPITEGVSASLLEAMACGCFPIVTDLPANRDWIVDGETGCLVPSGDWKRLACSLTAASVDPSMRARAAHRNRALVESRASLSVNIGRFVDVYRSLVRGAP